MAAKKKQSFALRRFMLFFVLIALLIAIYLLLVYLFEKGENDKPSDSALSSFNKSVSQPVSANSANGETSEPEEQTEPTEIVSQVEIDNEWAFILINADNPLPDGYEPTTKSVYNNGERDYVLDSRCYEYAIKMLADAKLAGFDLNVVSAYRSTELQQMNIESSINRLMEQGYTYEEAEKLTMKEIQYPGCSEHNAGLAMDIVTQDWWSKHTEVNTAFDKTSEYDWLSANSWKYGFILRYPIDKEDITNISYEPWHYRFVGLYHAQKITETGLCLEEYFESLQ